MLNAGNLFRLLNEFILLLLGALLILLAFTGRVGLPGPPAAVVALGIVLVYWGVRAWVRPEAKAARAQTYIRAGSLALVGLLVLGIPVLPVRDSEVLLEVAGGVLILRGVLGAILTVRQS